MPTDPSAFDFWKSIRFQEQDKIARVQLSAAQNFVFRLRPFLSPTMLRDHFSPKTPTSLRFLNSVVCNNIRLGKLLCRLHRHAMLFQIQVA